MDDRLPAELAQYKLESNAQQFMAARKVTEANIVFKASGGVQDLAFF